MLSVNKLLSATSIKQSDTPYFDHTSSIDSGFLLRFCLELKSH